MTTGGGHPHDCETPEPEVGPTTPSGVGSANAPIKDGAAQYADYRPEWSR